MTSRVHVWRDTVHDSLRFDQSIDEEAGLFEASTVNCPRNALHARRTSP